MAYHALIQSIRKGWAWLKLRDYCCAASERQKSSIRKASGEVAGGFARLMRRMARAPAFKFDGGTSAERVPG
jgi:hypothetical protein